MLLGINGNDQTAYEGLSTAVGRGLWPQPFLSQAKLFVEYPLAEAVPQSAYLNDFEILFREDHFDPVTRIRRGRFYEISKGHSRPTDWTPQAHPTMDHVNLSQDGRYHVSLVTFASLVFKKSEPNNFRFVSLGDREAYGVWKIIASERIQTGEFLVTLKNTSTSDLLPDLDSSKLEAAEFSRVFSFFQKVVEDAHRAGPASVIDRCRDAATALLIWGGARPSGYKVGDDLGHLLEKMESAESSSSNMMVRHCGHIIRLLHSRAKPSVQERHSPPALSEADGALAITSLAAMIRDLGLARG